MHSAKRQTRGSNRSHCRARKMPLNYGVAVGDTVGVAVGVVVSVGDAVGEVPGDAVGDVVGATEGDGEEWCGLPTPRSQP
jgi:hypothetical protein